MRPALADTHTLLWWLADDPRLSTAGRELIAAGETPVYFSAASAWEVAIKVAAGRLVVRADFVQALENDRFLQLPITVGHAIAAGALPPLHRDPFDRMIAAQAHVEGLVVITRDQQIGAYGVPVHW